MKRIFVFCVLTLAIAACNKDKVESTPHLKFKSFNTDVVDYNGALNATLEFTDQEGDIDSVFITRQRLNQQKPSYLDFYYHSAPQNVNQNKGELFLNFFNVSQDLDFNQEAIRIPGSSDQFEPDTLLLRFYVKDKAGHVSDTTSPKQLIVIR
jgi:hypothetical protein